MPSVTFSLPNLATIKRPRLRQAHALRKFGAPVSWDFWAVDERGDIPEGGIVVKGRMQRIINDNTRTVEYRW